MHDQEATQRQAYTVTQALNAAKRGLEQIRLTVIGEVSELSNKRGYKAVYFTVRDDKCALPCLIWVDKYRSCGIELSVGMLVELTGRFSCYTAKGRMQFSVDRIDLAGEGKLRLQVAQLARKLEAEGLMDTARKRKVKAFPQRIALVTSPNGKAVHDVIRTLRKRYPMGELLFCGVTVEGADAVNQILAGLECACAAQPAPDVILLVRGGGSYEDYMPFNDERLARAVVACPIPVVTGIGHEPDNSICDMVADHRSSTPTAAAEDITPTMAQLEEKLGNAAAALDKAFSGQLDAMRHQLERLADRPLWQDRQYLTGAHLQTLDYLSERLARAIPDALASDARQLESLGARLQRSLPQVLDSSAHQLEMARERFMRMSATLLKTRQQGLDALCERLLGSGPGLVKGHAAQVAVAAAKLDALSPLKTLSRGYSITYAADGHTVVDSIEKAEIGDRVSVQVKDGVLACKVDAVKGQGQ